MAKQPETADRYEIIIDTSIEQFGFVVAKLTNMEGVENIRHRLVTDVHAYRGRKRHTDMRSFDLAVQYVSANARFKLSDMVAYFKRDGREPNVAYYAIKKLADQNVIARNGDEYVRVEALTHSTRNGDARAKTKAKRPANKVHAYAVSNKALVEKFIRTRKQFTATMLRELFKSQKRPEKSASPLLTKLVQAKAIKQTGPGQYQVLAKGKKTKKPSKPKPATVKVAAEQAALTNGGAVANG